MKQLTTKLFRERLAGRDVVLIGEYKNQKTKTTFKCLVCKNVWEAWPGGILYNGQGCPKCRLKKISAANSKSNRIISDNGEFLAIDISTKMYNDSVMLIDKAVWDKISKKIGKVFPRRRAGKSWAAYAAAHLKQNSKLVEIHRLIMPESKTVDHINGDGLDNRITNLRSVTTSQNQMNTKTRSDNTSGVKGVHLDKSNGKWIAYIGVNKKTVRLGSFESKEEAVFARKRAESKYYKGYIREVQNGET